MPSKSRKLAVLPYAKKKASQVVNAGVKALAKRYNDKGKFQYQQILKDIMMIKSLMNVEKKRHQNLYTDLSVGQCNENASGYLALDLTPVMSQGVTDSTRNGSSIKLVSSFMKMQIYGQVNTAAGIRLKILYFKTRGRPVTNLNDEIIDFFLPNPWVNNLSSTVIIDYNSKRNPDYAGNLILIRTRYVSLKPDNISGQHTITNCQIGMKYKNHHVRFDGNTNDVTGGQIICYILADTGNCSATTNSTLLGILHTGLLTGAYIQCENTSYYVDN